MNYHYDGYYDQYSIIIFTLFVTPFLYYLYICKKEFDDIYKINKNNKNKNNITSVYILGDKGRLGSLISTELLLDTYPNLKFVRGIGKNIDLTHITDDSSVIIDVSQPEGTIKLLKELINQQVYCPLIIGTTGHKSYGELSSLLNEHAYNAPIAICSNFSKGITQMKKIIDIIDKNKWKVSMIEKHHINKKDAPSGTAKMLSAYYGKIDMSIQSIREGDIIGEHELILEGLNETIKISHIAKSRKLFVEGCIDWINWITTQDNGMYYEMK